MFYCRVSEDFSRRKRDYDYNLIEYCPCPILGISVVVCTTAIQGVTYFITLWKKTCHC